MTDILFARLKAINFTPFQGNGCLRSKNIPNNLNNFFALFTRSLWAEFEAPQKTPKQPICVFSTKTLPEPRLLAKRFFLTFVTTHAFLKITTITRQIAAHNYTYVRTTT